MAEWVSDIDLADNGEAKLRVLVVVREVYDSSDIPFDPVDERGEVKRGLLSTRFDQEDLNALEMALKLKDNIGAGVVALALGKTLQVDVAKECLYRGADEAVKIAGNGFDAADVLKKGMAVAEYVREKGDFDLIITGVSIVEGEGALIGPHIAGVLGLPCVTYAEEIVEVKNGHVEVKRAVEGGEEIVQVILPAVLAVGVALYKDDPRAPRPARARLKLKHKKTEILEMDIDALIASDKEHAQALELVGRRTIPAKKVETIRIEWPDESSIKTMLASLRDEKII